MSSSRLPRAGGWAETHLRPIRQALGFRIDIRPEGGVSDLYDFSPVGIRAEGDGFTLGSPIEFDLVHMRVFYNSSAIRRGGLITLEDIQSQAAAAENKPEPVWDGIRHIILDDAEDTIPAKEIEISPAIKAATPDELELIYKYRYLNNINVNLIFGVTMLFTNRLGSLDRYCIWDRFHKDDQEKRIINFPHNEAELLLNTGWKVNCCDLRNLARKILSQERVRLQLELPRSMLPKVLISLEIALDGILYVCI